MAFPGGCSQAFHCHHHPYAIDASFPTNMQATIMTTRNKYRNASIDDVLGLCLAILTYAGLFWSRPTVHQPAAVIAPQMATLPWDNESLLEGESLSQVTSPRQHRRTTVTSHHDTSNAENDVVVLRRLCCSLRTMEFHSTMESDD